MAEASSRKARMNIRIPIRVRGFEANSQGWEEMSVTADASIEGISLTLQRSVTVGTVLRLALPLPKRFRRYDFSEPSYHVYALVRNVAALESGARVGVMFLGKTPPRGFEENPTGRFLLPEDPRPGPVERRQVRRFGVFLNVWLRRLEADGRGPVEEQTVAENVSKGGARVLTSLAVAKGETLAIEEIGGDFRARAEVRNLYIGKDNVPRLNLKFLDSEPPDRIVAER